MPNRIMEQNRRISTKFVNLNLSLKDVFRAYLEFTKPIHKMRPQELMVLSLFMYYNYIEMPNFKHSKDRWKKVFDIETKSKIKGELGLNPNVFQNLLTTLRKKKAIVRVDGYNKISPNYMIDIKPESKIFNLSINFKLNGHTQRVSTEV